MRKGIEGLLEGFSEKIETLKSKLQGELIWTHVCNSTINDLPFSIRTNHVVLLTVAAFKVQSGTYHAGMLCTSSILYNYL